MMPSMKPLRISGKTCETNHIKCAKAREAHHKAVVVGDENGPIVDLLDRVLVKMREAANLTVVDFHKQFKEALVPRVPAEHLPVLVSCTYSTMSQFCMAIWQMVADECIMPMWHDYLTSFGLATMMQHALEKITKHLYEGHAPHPPEPKDDLTAFLDSLENTLVSRTLAPHTAMPAAPFSNLLPVPGVLPTGGSGVGSAAAIPVFGGAPLAPVCASMVTGDSLFRTSPAPPLGFVPQPASINVASTSSVPAEASETHKTTFNMKNHSKYLDIILSKPSITQDVVFMKEVGHAYFESCNIPTALYDQGLVQGFHQVVCA